MSWNPFGGMEEAAFKPVTGGYIYRAPSPWVFGRKPLYRVNEEQKAALVGHHRVMLHVMFWHIIAIGAAAGLFAGYMRDHGWLTLGVCVLVGLGIGIVLNSWFLYRLRPVLAGLTLTDEKITFGDSLTRQAAVFSPRFIIVYTLLSVALLALTTLNGFYGPGGWDLMAVVGTAMFGTCTLFWIVLFVIKYKRAAA